MNRNEARKIAETVSSEDLKQTFLNAQNSIKDWKQVSAVNKGLSKGIAFNIFTKGGFITADSHILAKTNAVREFGEFLPNYEKVIKEKKSEVKCLHEDPIFIS